MPIVGKELIEQGIEKGEENVIIRQVKARFPKLTASQERQIRELPGEKLEDLAIALLDFERLDDLKNWLGA